MLNTIEGVHKNLYEKLININLINKIPVKRGQLHYVSIEGLLPYSIGEGNFEIETMTRGDLQCDALESVEP